MSPRAKAVRCTASGQRRSWAPGAWLTGEGVCPDCGADILVWVRGTDLFPFGKARAHLAPAGVVPGPYAVLEGGGMRPFERLSAEMQAFVAIHKTEGYEEAFA